MKSIKSISAAYASALYNVAEAEGCIDRIESDLFALKEIFSESSQLREFLTDRLITEEGKKKVMEEIFSEKMSSLLVNQLKMIIDNGRVKNIPDIIDEFFTLTSSSAGKINAEVVSAIELNDSLKASLNKKLISLTGKDVNMRTSVDEAIVGGLVIKLGEKIIDASISKKLIELRKHIKSS